MNSAVGKTSFSNRSIKWLFIIIYIILSLFVMGRYLVSSNLGDTWRGATFQSMMDGEAERPYVYRRLVPEITKALIAITPEDVRLGVGEQAKSYLDEQGLIKFYKEQRRIFGYAMKDASAVYSKLVLSVVIFAFVWMFILSMQGLARELYGSQLATYLAPVIGLLIIPMVMSHIAFVYDLAGLALASMCYYLLYTKRYKWFLLGFVLACLNKETAIFITFIFALHCFGQMERKKYLMLLGIQILLFIGIFATIYMVYLDNLEQPKGVSYMAIQISYLLANGYNFSFVSAMLMVWFLLSANWYQKPSFARLGIIQLLLMFVAYFCFGKAGEFRVFLDILPLPILLITHTLCCLWPERRAAKL